jgi:HSP20 family protein
MIPLQRITRPLFPELRHEVDRLFENFLGPEALGFRPLGGARPFPALNVWEDDRRLFVEAEIPGLGMKDVEILVQGNELTLKGQRAAMEGESVVYHRQERGAGEFVRFLTLPVEVDPDSVEATLKDGVLTIVLPKAETARARKITVKTA